MPASTFTPISPVPSPRQVAESVSEKGGFTARQLGEWGVPWPPPAGWKEALMRAWSAEHATVEYKSMCPENASSTREHGHDWTIASANKKSRTKLWVCTHCGGAAVTMGGRK